jgi:hypothetical protein
VDSVSLPRVAVDLASLAQAVVDLEHKQGPLMAAQRHDFGRGLRTATWQGGGDRLALVLPAGSWEPQTLMNRHRAAGDKVDERHWHR